MPVRADAQNEQNAIVNHGYKWISWLDIPRKGTPGYPEEIRVRQLMSPGQLNSDRWKAYWAKREGRYAVGSEPLSYAYYSSGGGVEMYPVATEEELKTLVDFKLYKFEVGGELSWIIAPDCAQALLFYTEEINADSCEIDIERQLTDAVISITDSDEAGETETYTAQLWCFKYPKRA